MPSTLSILDVLRAGQLDPTNDPDNPLRGPVATTPAEAPAERPAQVIDFGSPLANFIAGRTAVGGRIASGLSDLSVTRDLGSPVANFLFGRAATGDRAAAQVVAPLIQGLIQQQRDRQERDAVIQTEQRRQALAQQGVRGFQEALSTGDLDGAERVAATLQASGMNVGALLTMVGRARSSRLAEVIAQSDLSDPTKAIIIAGLRDGSIDAKTALEKITAHNSATAFDIRQADDGSLIRINKATGETQVVSPGLGKVVGSGSSLVRPGPQGPFAAFTAPTAPDKESITKVTADQIADINGVADKTGFRATETTRFSEIPDSVWAAIRQQKIDDAAARKASLVAAVQAGQENALAPAHVQTRTFNVKTLQPVQGARTVNQINEGIDSGQLVTADPKDISDARQGRSLVQPLNDVERVVKKLMAIAPGQNVANAAKLAVQRGLATDADARVIEAYSESLGLRIGAVWNKGRPTEADKRAAQIWLPNSTDTVQTALSRIGRLRWMLQSSEDIFLGRPPRDFQDSSFVNVGGKTITIPGGVR